MRWTQHTPDIVGLFRFFVVVVLFWLLVCFPCLATWFFYFLFFWVNMLYWIKNIKIKKKWNKDKERKTAQSWAKARVESTPWDLLFANTYIPEASRIAAHQRHEPDLWPTAETSQPLDSLLLVNLSFSLHAGRENDKLNRFLVSDSFFLEFFLLFFIFMFLRPLRTPGRSHMKWVEKSVFVMAIIV